MSLKADLKTYLLGKSAIGALVGTRMRPGAAKKGDTLPYITYKQIGGSDDHHQQGVSRLAEVVIQINCVAAGAEAAETLRNAVRDALGGFQGMMGSTQVRNARIVGKSDGFVQPRDGGPITKYKEILDVAFDYFEALPTFAA